MSRQPLLPNGILVKSALAFMTAAADLRNKPAITTVACLHHGCTQLVLARLGGMCKDHALLVSCSNCHSTSVIMIEGVPLCQSCLDQYRSMETMANGHQFQPKTASKSATRAPGSSFAWNQHPSYADVLNNTGFWEPGSSGRQTGASAYPPYSTRPPPRVVESAPLREIPPYQLKFKISITVFERAEFSQKPKYIRGPWSITFMASQATTFHDLQTTVLKHENAKEDVRKVMERHPNATFSFRLHAHSKTKTTVGTEFSNSSLLIESTYLQKAHGKGKQVVEPENLVDLVVTYAPVVETESVVFNQMQMSSKSSSTRSSLVLRSNLSETHKRRVGRPKKDDPTAPSYIKRQKITGSRSTNVTKDSIIAADSYGSVLSHGYDSGNMANSSYVDKGSGSELHNSDTGSLTENKLTLVGPSLAIQAVGGYATKALEAPQPTFVTVVGDVFKLVYHPDNKFYHKPVANNVVLDINKQEIGRGSFRRVCDVIGGRISPDTTLPPLESLVFKHFLSSSNSKGDIAEDEVITLLESLDKTKTSSANLKQQAFAKLVRDRFYNEDSVSALLDSMGVDFDFITSYGIRLSQNMTFYQDCFLEQRLYGKFVKFYNNDGIENRELFALDPNLALIFDALSAFCHYVFVKFNQRILITDLQGGVDGSRVLLTDVAVNAEPSEHSYFGPGNLVEALTEFKKSHSCGRICTSLGYSSKML